MRSTLYLSLVALSISAQPQLSHVDVFKAGSGGYSAYRIPTIVAAGDGSLLVFAEARRDNRGDPGGGDIDLVCSRSTDQGRTWSPPQLIDDPGEKWSASNPTPLLDRSNGRLWIFYNRWEPGMGTIASRPGTNNNQMWARTSDDHGQSWSAPRDLTRVSRDYDTWGAIFLGPGGAIQTRSGRLLIPAAMKYDAYSLVGAHGSESTMRTYTIFSDDNGKTWQRGSLTHALTNENQMVELADGSVLMDARQNSGEHRWNMFTNDGGKTWSRPRPGQAVAPICASIRRYSSETSGDRNRLLWTAPAGPGRKNLVIRISYDEGQTWMNERLLYGGLAAYSDIVVLPKGNAGVVWERGVSDTYQFVTFTSFNREFLEPTGTLIPSIR